VLVDDAKKECGVAFTVHGDAELWLDRDGC